MTIIQELMDSTRAEAARVHGELESTAQFIDRHRREAEELIRRYRAVTEQLQSFQPGQEAQAHKELVAVFDEALEAQRQLLAARGQLEKLESRHEILVLYARHLDSILNEFGEVLPRTLHDEVAPPLTNCSLQIEIIQRLLDRRPEEARSELQELKGTITTAIQRIRGLMTELRTPR